jgi:ureidoacrylate peracid hydrolase
MKILQSELSEPPILVLIDIQREYVTPGRPFFLSGIGPSLQQCRALLDHAREGCWPVAHVHHVTDKHLFNRNLEYSQPVAGFAPRAHEMLFQKDKLSCFSNRAFEELIESASRAPVLVAGYNSPMCCTATIVDAFNRGHRFHFVSDASWARPIGARSESESHLAACDLLRLYADVVSTADVTGMEVASSPLQSIASGN